MIAVRSALFHLLSALTTLVFLIFLPLVWAPLWLGWPVLRAFIRVQLWLLQVICGQTYQVHGAAEIGATDDPVILASRHEAMWESFVLPVIFDNPIVFMKDDVMRLPVAGAVARKLGYIPLDRSGSADRARRAFQTARARRSEGRNFLIFPNGTRAPEHRDRVLKGVAVLYRALDLACVPIVVDSGRYWPYRSWLRFPGRIHITVRPAIPRGLKTAAFLARLEQDLRHPAEAAARNVAFEHVTAP